MTTFKRNIALLTAILFISAGSLSAQNTGSEFQMANRLMQQEKYSEALPVMRRLHQNNPDAYIFFDRYLECLIVLGELEEAEQVARSQIHNNRLRIQPSLRLAEILHIKGNKDEAFDTWNRALDENRGDVQSYYSVASSMIKRREYNAAADIYKTAQTEMNNPSLFLNELADSYMQAGRFEEAVNEYFRLVIQNPDQMAMVQQRFLRSRDNQLYNIASFELEDLLLDLDMSEASYSQLYQLLTWLLLETGEYQRALNFARFYEQETSYTIYSLMALGHQLKSAGQYEYAAEAYSYYAENETGTNKFRSMEELANTYRAWSRTLQQNNTGTGNRIDDLYRNAYDTASSLIEEAPNYERADRVFALLIDISLDQFKDHELARNWHGKMMNHVGPDDDYAYYAEGRIALFEKDFVRSRQLLTRADRNTDSSDLSERARYFLGLSDFFAGDFEFAEIQFQTLERRHTSFYANDAVKVRMWIKNGTRADSTGSVLKAIGSALQAVHSGQYEAAFPVLEPVMANSGNPFVDDLVTEFSALLPAEYDPALFLLLDRQIESRPYSPLLERMMWDRALVAEQLLNRIADRALNDFPMMFEFLESSSADRLQQLASELDRQYVSDLYEEIIIKFPDGFYASFARDKLQSSETRPL